jgi:hypothetical protein
LSHANLSVLINIVVYQRDRDRLWCDTLASLPGIKVDRDIWQLLCSPSVLRSFATAYLKLVNQVDLEIQLVPNVQYFSPSETIDR